MLMRVTDLAGAEICTVELEKEWRTEQLKGKIALAVNINPLEQHLLDGTRELLDGELHFVNDSVGGATIRLSRWPMDWPQDIGKIIKDKSVLYVRNYVDLRKCSPMLKAYYNTQGQTLMFYAVQNPDALEMVMFLDEDCGVELDAVDVTGQSAAHYLAKTEHIDCLDYFVARGCDIDRRDCSGQSPIFFAASRGNPAMIRALFERGADVRHRDIGGKPPLAWACSPTVLPKNIQALSLCSLRINHNLLAWSTRDDGSIYAVFPSEKSDIARLCGLETEFIHDHGEMMRDVLGNASENELSGILGLADSPRERAKTISMIVGARNAKQWTLTCVHIAPSSTGKMHRQLVGYCYCFLKDTGWEVSHLKIGKDHQRRGCATLLLAGVVENLERLQGRGHERLATDGAVELEGATDEVTRRLNLSVIEPNRSALVLYNKLGFVGKVMRDKPVSWVRMYSKTPFQELLRHWLGLVPGIAEVAGSSRSTRPGIAEVAGNSRSTRPLIEEVIGNSRCTRSGSKALPPAEAKSEPSRKRVSRTPATASAGQAEKTLEFRVSS